MFSNIYIICQHWAFYIITELKILMLGKTEGRRRRGRQRMRWLDGIADSMDMSLSKLCELMMDRCHKESDTIEWLNWTEGGRKNSFLGLCLPSGQSSCFFPPSPSPLPISTTIPRTQSFIRAARVFSLSLPSLLFLCRTFLGLFATLDQSGRAESIWAKIF